MLKDCNPDEIKRTLEWITKEARKPLSASLLEFQEFAGQFMSMRPKPLVNHAPGSEGQLPPPWDHHDEIPQFSDEPPRDELDAALNATDNDSQPPPAMGG